MKKIGLTKPLAIVALFLVAAVMAFPPAAHATPTLTLYDGTTTVTVADGALGLDSNPAAGVITWIGNLGVWSINVSTGASSSPAPAVLHLNSFDTSTAAGNLTITFSDNMFSVPGPNAGYAMSGSTTFSNAGSMTYSAYYATNNVVGNQANLIDQMAFTFSGLGSDSGDRYGNLTLPSPNLFSLTQVVEITHDRAGTSSFDAHLVVPLPSTAILLGTGVLGLVGLGWRRRKW